MPSARFSPLPWNLVSPGYDLSPLRRTPVQARLTQDYAHCVGIEILQPLHSAAQLVTNRYDARVKGLLDRGRPQVGLIWFWRA